MEQDVLQRLTTTFMNIQFIVSTHSPLVISNTSLGENGKIILLQHNQEGYDHTSISDQYGMDYEFVLSAVMQTEPRNVKLQQLMSKYLRLMRREKEEIAQDTLLSIKELVTEDRFEQITKELKKQLVEE
jgi:predicted ATP-binding protein involved in virulence